VLRELSPEQADKNWDVLKFGIDAALPDQIVPRERIREALLERRLTAWAAYGLDKKVNGLLFTTVHYDAVNKAGTLYVYAGWAAEKTGRTDWQEGYSTLCAYAKQLNLQTISFHTNNPKMLNIASKLKAYVENHVIILVL